MKSTQSGEKALAWVGRDLEEGPEGRGGGGVTWECGQGEARDPQRHRETQRRRDAEICRNRDTEIKERGRNRREHRDKENP